MKKQYVTDDGRIFGTEEEATAHETQLAEIKANKEKLTVEKKARKDEIQADYKALMKKIDQYNSDYGEPLSYVKKTETPSLMINDLFNLLDILTW